MKHLSIAVILAAVLFAGCGKESEQSLWKKVQASHENNNADSTILVCQTLLRDYPTGTLAPGALYMMAETYYRMKHDPRTATGYYRLFIDKYPDVVQTPVAMFLIGFIYNNDLRNLDSARIGYRQFLEKYPTHDLAQSAKFELDNLGKSADEILAEQHPKSTQKK
jgi:outer membrane protein assembly factor BamD (BamD/ComL family)